MRGDLHDIGKNVVRMLLDGAGFEVIGLGVDVEAKCFVEKLQETDAHILGMSAMPTVTMPEMGSVVEEIRKTVDEYLARGKIEQAKEFMEQKRQYLASMGHYIRKLNQAYFAFYGTYADRPTSISPIGLELKELRSQSASLKDFLNTVAVMASRQELRASITVADAVQEPRKQ